MGKNYSTEIERGKSPLRSDPPPSTPDMLRGSAPRGDQPLLNRTVLHLPRSKARTDEHGLYSASQPCAHNSANPQYQPAQSSSGLASPNSEPTLISASRLLHAGLPTVYPCPRDRIAKPVSPVPVSPIPRVNFANS